jgi:hypothetical protein
LARLLSLILPGLRRATQRSFPARLNFIFNLHGNLREHERHAKV